jgi:cytoskeleton protein RodZ
MSVQPAAELDENKVVEMADTPGRRLRAARQRYGLDLERVAAELHLKPAAIKAIEHDDYAALPGPVFTAGYMRNYARLLNMDPEPLLAAYRAATQEESSSAPPFHPAAPPRPRSNGQGMAVVRTASLVLLVALAALALIWWQTQSPFREGSTPMEAASSAIDTQAGGPEQEGPKPVPAATPVTQKESGTVIAPVPAPAQPPAVTAPDIGPPAQTAPPPPVAPSEEPAGSSSATATSAKPSENNASAAGPPTAPEAAKGVVLEFSGPCWVDIRSRDKSHKLFGEMHQGDRRVLEGTPPYSVILGNAAAVKVTVNGAPFDLKPFVRGNVARFKLDPSHLP